MTTIDRNTIVKLKDLRNIILAAITES